MKKGSREVKEKRVTSLLGEEEGDGEAGDVLSEVHYFTLSRPKVLNTTSPEVAHNMALLIPPLSI